LNFSLLVTVCAPAFGQDAVNAGSGASIPAPSASSQATDLPPQSDKPSYYLEIGGFYHSLDNNYGTWRGGDIKLGFTGLPRFSPYFTFSSQTRSGGSQQNYGTYSYVTLGKGIYSVVGVSGAPEKKAILYPKVRMDVGLFVPVLPKGLILSIGHTEFFMGDGGGGGIQSFGAIYYHGRLVLSGGGNVNRSRPGADYSSSGQAGFQFGSQGKYWIGAGMSGGKIAYQTLGLVPFDVRFDTVGTNVFYQQWLTGKFGVILHYDFQNQFEAFRRHGGSLSFFFEF